MKTLRLPVAVTGTFTKSGYIQPGVFFQANTNRGEFIQFCLQIERQCSDVISAYFFHDCPGKSGVFEERILHTNWFSFENKRSVFIDLMARENIIVGSERVDFEKGFARIIEWRNALAHGRLHQYDETVVLHYFKGAPQSVNIDDSFWDAIESQSKDFGEKLNVFYNAFWANIKKNTEPNPERSVSP